MTAKLTAEQIDALRQLPAGEPLPMTDGKSDKRYFLMDEDTARDFAIYLLTRELQPAFDEEQRGEMEPWDVEEIIAEGEREMLRRKQAE